MRSNIQTTTNCPRLGRNLRGGRCRLNSDSSPQNWRCFTDSSPQNWRYLQGFVASVKFVASVQIRHLTTGRCFRDSSPYMLYVDNIYHPSTRKVVLTQNGTPYQLDWQAHAELHVYGFSVVCVFMLNRWPAHAKIPGFCVCKLWTVIAELRRVWRMKTSFRHMRGP